MTELDNNKTDQETAQRARQLHQKLYEEVTRLTEADSDLQVVFEESHKGLIMKLSNKFKQPQIARRKTLVERQSEIIEKQ